MERLFVRESAGERVWRQAAFFLLTLGAVALCFLVLHPFLPAVVGAVILAVVTKRPYDWMAAGMRSRSASAALMVLLVVFSVIVPGVILGDVVVRQMLSAAAVLGQPATQAKIGDFFSSNPRLVERFQNIADGVDANDLLRNVALFLGKLLANVVGHSILMVTQLVIMVVLLFFLYRDRVQALKMARLLIPLRRDETDALLVRCTDTIYATVVGRFAIACVQGILSGLAYWVMGVPKAALWGLLTALASLIPAIGAVLVWAPIAVFLGLAGHWGKAALLAVWGGLVVSLIDNVLYPILVGTRVRSHTAIILLSILGGVAVFGVTGIVLGPLCFTIAATLLEFWRGRAEEAHEE